MTKAAEAGTPPADLRRPADPGLQHLLAGLMAVRGGDFGTRLSQVGDPLMDEIATAGIVHHAQMWSGQIA